MARPRPCCSRMPDAWWPTARDGAELQGHPGQPDARDGGARSLLRRVRLPHVGADLEHEAGEEADLLQGPLELRVQGQGGGTRLRLVRHLLRSEERRVGKE